MEFIDAIGRYGLPTVSAAVMVWLFVWHTRRESARADRAENRQADRSDRLEKRLLDDDGNGGKGEFPKLASQVAEVKESVSQLNGRVATLEQGQVSIEARVDERFGSIEGSLSTIKGRVSNLLCRRGDVCTGERVTPDK